MNWKQLPNIITSIRLILLVPLSFYLARENYQTAVIIFFIAGISDALDGFLAKKFGWVSRFGSMLDPIADKALLVITMALLTMNQKIDILLFSAVALRDVFIVIGAYIYYKRVGLYQMEPSVLSKINTFVQILLVTLILVSASYFPVSKTVFDWLTFLVYLTVISSSVHYTYVWGRKYRLAKQKT